MLLPQVSLIPAIFNDQVVDDAKLDNFGNLCHKFSSIEFSTIITMSSMVTRRSAKTSQPTASQPPHARKKTKISRDAESTHTPPQPKKGPSAASSKSKHKGQGLTVSEQKALRDLEAKKKALAKASVESKKQGK